MSKRIKSKKYTGVYYRILDNQDKAYDITYKENNKKIWLKIGLHSQGIREAYCNQKRNEIVSKLRLGEDLPQVAQKNVLTLDEVAKNFFDEKELHNKQNKKTRARVETHVQKTLGHYAINKITKEQISKLQKNLLTILEPSSVNFIIGQFSAMFNWAMKNDLINKNPCIHVQNLKVDNARLRYLELEEIQQLKESLQHDKSIYYFAMLGLATGGRLQTLCHIKPKDIKDNGTIRLYDFKNESEYYGFLTSDFRDELKEFLKEINKKDDDYIFQATSNSNYTNQYYYRKLQPVFNKLFNKHLKKEDRKHRVTIHTLRHTFASQLAINETPILTIKKLMNHNDIGTTMKYAKLSKSSGEKHVNRLIESIMSV
jgi:site-specific recombinase XerD